MSVSLSVVIPVFEAADCVAPLCERLAASLPAVHPSHEIILIDDGSADGSWPAIERAAKTYPAVRAARLSRNFGQHLAITAGLSLAQGERVVVMDCDLQDAPEDIGTLYRKADEGYDVVLALQPKEYGTLMHRIGSKIYHAVIRICTGYRWETSVGNFSLLSRKVVDAFLSLQDAHRHYLILLRWLGFRHAVVPVARHARIAGPSSYRLAKLASLALDGVIAQSNVLLRGSIQVGLLAAFVSLALAFDVIYNKLVHPSVTVGWTSLMATVLLIGGLILMSLGILGLYIDKVFFQTKHRPLFLIDEKIRV